MTTYDEDLNLDDELDDDDTPLIRKLRTQLDEQTKHNRKLQQRIEKQTEREREVEKRERLLAVRDSDLKRPDGSPLSDKQVNALLSQHEGEFTREALRATARELGWDVPEETTAAEESLETQDRVAQATQGAQPVASGVITPGDAAGWSTERTIRFKKEHPNAFESLKRGETVSGISF